MFRDRYEAGRFLANRLSRYRGQQNVLVLGLARGGVPVARVVAEVLGVPMDVFLVRKLGLPWQPELAFGAIAEGGVRVIDQRLVRHCDLSSEIVEEIAERERIEIERRSQLYRGGQHALEVRGRDVIIVDDGVATGSTMLAAVRALRHRLAHRVVVAVPVGSQTACTELLAEADEVLCLSAPQPFHSVGTWYEDFAQVSDEEVRQALSATSPHEEQLRT